MTSARSTRRAASRIRPEPWPCSTPWPARSRTSTASLAVKWGDVLRFRRGNADLPGNGAPSELGAIRTIGVGPFKNGTVEAVRGDTFYAVIEYSVPQRAEVLLNYGNWSKKGSTHIDDQLPLASRKQMRPMWRTKAEIEPNLERRMVLGAGATPVVVAQAAATAPPAASASAP